MTREKAIEGFKNLYKDIDKNNHLFVGTINPEFIKIAIESLEAWDKVIHSLNCLDRLEYTDCDKPFNVYPKSNVDAIINKYMKEVEDDKG